MDSSFCRGVSWVLITLTSDWVVFHGMCHWWWRETGVSQNPQTPRSEWVSRDLMLWPGALWPPDIQRSVVTTLGERAGIVTSRQRNGEEHGRFRGILFPCPCTGSRHMDVNFSKQRPKTQWYVKVGHSRHRHRDGKAAYLLHNYLSPFILCPLWNAS
jgi:hypothetical protein